MKAHAAALFTAVVALLWLAIGSTGRCDLFESPLPTHSPIAVPTRQYAPPQGQGQGPDDRQMGPAPAADPAPAGDAVGATPPEPVLIPANTPKSSDASETRPTLSPEQELPETAPDGPAAGGAPALGPEKRGGVLGVKPSPQEVQ